MVIDLQDLLPLARNDTGRQSVLFPQFSAGLDAFHAGEDFLKGERVGKNRHCHAHGLRVIALVQKRGDFFLHIRLLLFGALHQHGGSPRYRCFQRAQTAFNNLLRDAGVLNQRNQFVHAAGQPAFAGPARRGMPVFLLRKQAVFELRFAYLILQPGSRRFFYALRRAQCNHLLDCPPVHNFAAEPTDRILLHCACRQKLGFHNDGHGMQRRNQDVGPAAALKRAAGLSNRKTAPVPLRIFTPQDFRKFGVEFVFGNGRHFPAPCACRKGGQCPPHLAALQPPPLLVILLRPFMQRR
ncbi:MAG: hypothetical protein OD817_02485 [Gammaproteobacteria bacterium]